MFPDGSTLCSIAMRGLAHEQTFNSQRWCWAEGPTRDLRAGFDPLEVVFVTAQRAEWLVRALLDPADLDRLSRAEAASILVELAALQASLAARLSAPPAAPTNQSKAREPDRLMTVDEVAVRLGVTPRWLYRHAKQLPFTRKLSRRTLRFSEMALRHWEPAHK
jgi:predicted DNA-binding transcriptional regulator AlpA